MILYAHDGVCVMYSILRVEEAFRGTVLEADAGQVFSKGLSIKEHFSVFNPIPSPDVQYIKLISFERQP